ncbi:MFS transporter [Dactylosporangium sp. NPDC005572]|uniref:MFS transporter n=1 Tax=Dactylosporangium sp. NPDC005572 TaxID=3156889 RepID=UPI0033AB4D10
MHIDTAPRLVTPPLLLRLVSVAASSIGFYLPLSVVPMLAGPAAGLATVSLLAATVVVELVTPQLVARAGYRWALAAGLVLLGAPAVALSFDASPAVIVAVSVLRGAGFAVCTVAGGALTAMLIPAGRRGEGLALVGLTSGVTSLLALPAGVWVATRWGFAPVFAATAACTLLALLSIPGLPRRTAAAGRDHRGHRGVLAGLRSPAVTRPAAIFAASTTAIGVLVTYLPLATAGLPAWVAPAALLAQPAAATAARWFAGRLGDRHGPARLLTPGLLLAALGTAGLAGGPLPMVAGALLLGAGFGVLQNATLTLMYNRAPTGGESMVSAIWNSAYDLGMAAGALVAGLVVASAGYPATFLLTAAAMLPALALIRRDRRPEELSRTGRGA